MIILGIDPGTRACGYGLIETDGALLKAVDYGAICSTDPVLEQRLRVIYEGLVEVIKRHGPHVTALEGAYYGVNPRTAIRMGEGRGVALLAAASFGLEVFEYSPAVVKRAVVGSGRAGKYQVQQMIRHLLDLPEIPTPDDAADALAIAFCHCQRARTLRFQ